MNFLTLPDLVARLADANLTTVSKATGLAYNTLKNIKDGKGAQWSTIEKLSEYYSIEV